MISLEFSHIYTYIVKADKASRISLVPVYTYSTLHFSVPEVPDNFYLRPDPKNEEKPKMSSDEVYYSDDSDDESKATAT